MLYKKTKKIQEGHSSIKTDIDVIKRKFKGKKKQIITYLVIGLILAPFAVGLFAQYVQLLFNPRKVIVITKCFKIGFTGLGLIASAFIYYMYVVSGYRIYSTFHHDYYTDTDGDFQTTEGGEYGRAHFQTTKELQTNLNYAKSPLDLPECIMGIDDEGTIYGYSTLVKGLNKNSIMFGPSGSGKTASEVHPMIFQNIINGTSMVVTDSKGDVYRNTAHVARKNGYVIRVLNLKPGWFKNSNGVDLLKIFRMSEDADAKAEVLAEVIINNTMDGKRDYFAINELNLVKALLLLVSKETYVKNNRSNFAEIKRMVSATDALTKIKTEFELLDDEDPAKEAFNIFLQAKPDVQMQFVNGLGNRLGKIGNKNIKNILSHDEIDLLLPMKKKCIYYVTISDTDKAFRFIATLFFEELFMSLIEYADSMTEEEKKKRIPVHFILDEYKNTGAIPEMDQKVSTVRSRDIMISVILQDIGQLESMYPDLWETILNNTSYKVLLGTTDQKTAEWFSKNLGTKTMRVSNDADMRNTGEVLDGKEEYRVMGGKGQRPLRYPAELMNELSENDKIILMKSRQPILLHKYFDFNHPLYEEAMEKIYQPNKYCPKWRRDMELKEKNEDKEIENIIKEKQNNTKEKKTENVQNNNRQVMPPFKRTLAKDKLEQEDEIVDFETGEIISKRPSGTKDDNHQSSNTQSFSYENLEEEEYEEEAHTNACTSVLDALFDE